MNRIDLIEIKLVEIVDVDSESMRFTCFETKVERFAKAIIASGK